MQLAHLGILHGYIGQIIWLIYAISFILLNGKWFRQISCFIRSLLASLFFSCHILALLEWSIGNTLVPLEQVHHNVISILTSCLQGILLQPHEIVELCFNITQVFICSTNTCRLDMLPLKSLSPSFLVKSAHFFSLEWLSSL